MAKFLRGGGGGFVQKDIGLRDEAYLTFDLTFDSAHPTGDFGDFADAFSSLVFGVRWDGPDWAEHHDTFDSAASPAPAPLGTFQTVELHYNNGVQTDVWVDGTLLWTAGEANNVQVQFVNVGGGNNYIDNVKVGTTRGGSDLFSDNFESGDLSAWDSVIGDVRVVDGFDPAARIGPPSFEWRFVVTKLNLRVLTFFDRLARDKKVTYTLNKAAIATGVVPADDPEVYLVQSDGFPLLEEGVRCLLGFRREGIFGAQPWVCRFAGIIMQLEDNVDENSGVAPYSTFTAYDPRQLLYSRPIRKADGNHVGADGLSFDATPGNEIALALLERTFDADGEHFIDVDSGSIESTPAMDIEFQQGTSVGEALDQLSDTGNLDIVLTALYDPIGTPNKLAVFNCYALAGTTRHKAVMAWDRPSRSLVGVNRLKDGTQRANRIRYTGGDGTVAGTESDFDSANQYGDYWAQQTFPGKNVEAVELLAAEQLLIRAKGVQSYKLSPVPGSLGQIDSPLVFLDYTLGDVVPIYASSRLRHEIAVGKRVVSIPINIADDGRERIEELELGEGEVEVS